MAALYPAADERFHHQVCDAIELWMDSARNADLVDYLLEMSQLDEFGTCRARLERWARARET